MLPHKRHPAPSGSRLTRRGLLALGTGAVGAGSLAACSAPAPLPFTRADVSDQGRFAHGVASGDPGPDSVVLWTRVTPEGDVEPRGPVEVSCLIATREDFSDAVRVETLAEPARDWCVKVTPTGLTPGTVYHYRFETGSDRSRTGQTKTLPRGALARAKFAVVSCANWQEGYFHAYDQIARRHLDTPYDALIHLGDYFYEYGAREGSVRLHEPPHETVSLADYRARHAQYRTDPGLQAATALMPLIAIWDDHESANDSSQHGAENHQPETEGDWDTRKLDAMRAYYDWMPVREPSDPNALWRSFSFGDLATLTCVETRLTARAESLDISQYAEEIIENGYDVFERDVLGRPEREMFGGLQRRFIVDSFKASKAAGQPWRVLANQVIMAKLMTPDLNPYVPAEALDGIRAQWDGIDDFMSLSALNVPLYPDSWDGYPAAREVFYGELAEAGITDMLVLTGDAHEFWANELTRADGTRMGAEFVTSSVSSDTLSKFLGDNTPDFNLLLTRENDAPKFYDATTRGFTELTLTPTKATVEMVGIDGVDRPDYTARRVARFTVRPTTRNSTDTLKITSPKGLNFKQRILFAGLG